MGIHICRFYRTMHRMFASVGILYNHESVHRDHKFVSKKIIRAALAIRDGRQEKLVLGDLEARVDWGYAPDYVDAMMRILALPAPDDFVIATGESHSVGEFVEATFQRLGLDPKAHFAENPSLISRRKPALVGDASRLRAAAGWRADGQFR